MAAVTVDVAGGNAAEQAKHQEELIWELRAAFKDVGHQPLPARFSQRLKVEPGGKLALLFGKKPRQVWVLAATDDGKDFGQVERILNAAMDSALPPSLTEWKDYPDMFLADVHLSYGGKVVFSKLQVAVDDWHAAADIAVELLRIIVSPGCQPYPA